MTASAALRDSVLTRLTSQGGAGYRVEGAGFVLGSKRTENGYEWMEVPHGTPRGVFIRCSCSKWGQHSAKILLVQNDTVVSGWMFLL